MRLGFCFASLVTLAMLAAPAGAQAAYPESLTGGWEIAREAQGDLDGDGRAEAVLVLRRDDPQLVKENDGLGAPRLDLNPRALLVLENEGEGWRQLARSDTLVPPAGSVEAPCLADPLEDGAVTIGNGVLSVLFNYWLSCGSYGVTIREYKFRLQEGRFRLIGFDRLEFSRATGRGDEVSTNYLTGRRKSVTGIAVIEPDEADTPREPPVESWEMLAAETLFFEDIDITYCEILENNPSWC